MVELLWIEMKRLHQQRLLIMRSQAESVATFMRCGNPVREPHGAFGGHHMAVVRISNAALTQYYNWRGLELQ